MEPSTDRRRRRPVRALAVALGLALALAGCGFDSATLQTYTPAHGVNVDAGGVKVRNLLVVSKKDGSGIVSATMVSHATDRLSTVAGVPIRQDGTTGAPLTVIMNGQVDLAPSRLVTLTSPTPLVEVSSPDLKPGLTVDLVLTFASGARTQVKAPVMGFEDPIYSTLTPTPRPTATANPGTPEVMPPSASPTATATP